MIRYLVLILVFFLSCKEVAKEVIKSTKTEPVLEGKYYDVKNYLTSFKYIMNSNNQKKLFVVLNSNTTRTRIRDMENLIVSHVNKIN